MHGRSVMLSQTAHQECLWRVRPSRVHYSSTRVIRLAAACHSFHLASPSPPQPCSWPGRTHSLPLHALAMSVVKPELGLQPDSFPAGLLWCSPGATRHLRTRPLLQVVMARPTARLHMHAAWRLPASRRLVCFSFRHRNAPAEPPVCDACRFRDCKRQ